MGYKIPGRNVGGAEGHKAAENCLTTDLKPCYFLLAGRVGWREVEKIRLAGIGSARRRKEVGLQSEVRKPNDRNATPKFTAP
jgi:hypothetical protein